MLRPLTDKGFHTEVRESLDPIVVMFTGSWCQPCKQFKPVIEEMAQQMDGDVHFVEMDIEHSNETATHLNIRSVPSLALVSDVMVREIHAGTMTKTELRLWIQENI